MHIYLLYKRQRQVEENKWDMFLDLVYTQKLCLSTLGARLEFIIRAAAAAVVFISPYESVKVEMGPVHDGGQCSPKF